MRFLEELRPLPIFCYEARCSTKWLFYHSCPACDARGAGQIPHNGLDNQERETEDRWEQLDGAKLKKLRKSPLKWRTSLVGGGRLSNS